MLLLKDNCFFFFQDIVANIYLLIVTTADTHVKLFVENVISQDETKQKVCFNLLHCILECANLPGYFNIDETSSSVTFSFWYSLQVGINIILLNFIQT